MQIGGAQVPGYDGRDLILDELPGGRWWAKYRAFMVTEVLPLEMLTACSRSSWYSAV